MSAEQNRTRLGVLMSNSCYAPGGMLEDVGNRFRSGDLKIIMTEQNWPEAWYKDPYFSVSVPVALDLAEALPSVKVFKLWYMPEQDFHCVEFDLEDDTYIVQWYKIFAIHRKSDGKKHYFGGRSVFPDWFSFGKHKTSPHWVEGYKTFNLFQESEKYR